MAYGLTKSVDLERGTPDYATVGDDADFDLGADWTIEAWVKIETLPTSGQEFAIVGKWLTTGDQRSYVVRLRNVSGSLYWEIVTDSNGAAGGASVYTTAAQTLSTDTWYHVAFVANSGSGAIYLDGVSVGSSGSVSTPHSGTANVAVGAERANDGSNSWDGEISLVRIWKGEARSESEINDNMCEVLGSTTNLSAEWTLDDVYTDNSGNGHTLTANGTPVFVEDVPAVCTAVAFTPKVMMF